MRINTVDAFQGRVNFKYMHKMGIYFFSIMNCGIWQSIIISFSPVKACLPQAGEMSTGQRG